MCGWSTRAPGKAKGKMRAVSVLFYGCNKTRRPRQLTEESLGAYGSRSPSWQEP